MARGTQITKRTAALPGGVGGTQKGGTGNTSRVTNPKKTSAVVDQGSKKTTMSTRPATGSFASVMMNQFTQSKGGGVSGKPRGAKSAKGAMPGY